MEVYPMGRASDCVSALVYVLPALAEELKVCKKMIKLWQSEEPPERPVALSPLVASLGFAGLAAALKLPGAAAVILAGFDGFLRTGEMFKLLVGDVHINVHQSAAVVTLRDTKGTNRKQGSVESIPMDDPWVIQVLCVLVKVYFTSLKLVQVVNVH